MCNGRRCRVIPNSDTMRPARLGVGRIARRYNIGCASSQQSKNILKRGPPCAIAVTPDFPGPHGTKKLHQLS
jgi:hypothetical protein